MNQRADNSKMAIGDIIASLNSLAPDQVQKIVQHQKDKGMRFGEAAVSLGMARQEDVVWALSKQFDYPYMGVEPQKVSPELVVATDPFNHTAEFFRDIRSRLLEGVFAGPSSSRPALAVCSLDSGDGKSFFSANLAIAFSQLKGKTLLIDGNMRNPRQHRLFGIENSVMNGLSTALLGVEEVNVLRPLEALPNLYLLPVGVVPPNPLELAQGDAFDFLITSVLSRFDHVIVDTPSAHFGADSRVIASKCGAALVLARKDVSDANALRDHVKNLKKSTRSFAGVVMNEVAAS